ncbi:MAG: hypothetical protein KatS3mg028_1122 [Bacteroidia bacterium]|nr:MAG: hypothetical protein KatS3mg028_1122 [Bacteroidia bacterium]
MFMLRWCLNLLIGIGEFTFITSAQIYTNLINNPSFEDTIPCPIWNLGFDTIGCPRMGGAGEICKANHWYLAFPYCANSPDYFNACANSLTHNSSQLGGVPKNQAGYQYARTGQGYAGVALWAYYNTYSVGIDYA